MMKMQKKWLKLKKNIRENKRALKVAKEDPKRKCPKKTSRRFKFQNQEKNKPVHKSKLNKLNKWRKRNKNNKKAKQNPLPEARKKEKS